LAWSSKFNCWEGSKQPLLRLGVSISHICCNPKWSRSSTSSTSTIQSKEKHRLHALDAQFSHVFISRETPVLNMTVSGHALLLSLSPPSNQIRDTQSFRSGTGYALRNAQDSSINCWGNLFHSIVRLPVDSLFPGSDKPWVSPPATSRRERISLQDSNTFITGESMTKFEGDDSLYPVA
jgi:hypothetical protein